MEQAFLAQMLSIALAMWLGSMFVYSGGLKLARYGRAAALAEPYRLLPTAAARATGLLLPWVEILAGALLLSGLLFPAGPGLALGLGISFAFAASFVLLRHERVDCGCTASRNPVDGMTLVRALVIAGAALVLVTSPTAPIVLMASPWAAGVLGVSLVPGLAVWREAREHRRTAHTHLVTQDAWAADITRARSLLSRPYRMAISADVVQEAGARTPEQSDGAKPAAQRPTARADRRSALGL